MNQLLLDLQPTRPPSLENFIPGENQELVARLRALADPGTFDAITLWGAPGSGKTHLLTAVARLASRHRPVVWLDRRPAGVDFFDLSGALLLVDDIESLDDATQITLFRLYNTARMIGLSLLLAGRFSPQQLLLREDLRTRIGQTLIYEVKTLDDDGKAAALHHHAAERGLKVDESLVRYLLAHGRRDLPSLMRVLDHLDRATLERQQPPTLPLLREILQRHLTFDPHEPHLV